MTNQNYPYINLFNLQPDAKLEAILDYYERVRQILRRTQAVRSKKNIVITTSSSTASNSIQLDIYAFRKTI